MPLAIVGVTSLYRIEEPVLLKRYAYVVSPVVTPSCGIDSRSPSWWSWLTATRSLTITVIISLTGTVGLEPTHLLVSSSDEDGEDRSSILRIVRVRSQLPYPVWPRTQLDRAELNRLLHHVKMICYPVHHDPSIRVRDSNPDFTYTKGASFHYDQPGSLLRVSQSSS